MPNKIFVDTSFIIALVNENDQYHERAKLLSYKLENSPLITTNAVLLEIGNGLAKNFKDNAIEIISAIRDSKNIDVIFIEDDLFNKGFELYKKYRDKNWGLVDCLSFAIMNEFNVKEVLTFDDDFEQAGFIVLSA